MERRIRGWRDSRRRGDRARKEQVAARILGLQEMQCKVDMVSMTHTPEVCELKFKPCCEALKRWRQSSQVVHRWDFYKGIVTG